MKHAPIVAALLAALALSAPVSQAADQTPATPAPAAVGPGSDTVVVLVSDTTFGPDAIDARDAARYYCANRGKVSVFVGKETPMEFRSQVLQTWVLMTYRCVMPGQAAN